MLFWQQHLFLTEEMMRVPATDLICPCLALDKASLPEAKLAEFLKASPLHFYITYFCQSVDHRAWQQRRTLAEAGHSLKICKPCYESYQHHQKQMALFRKASPLRAFDPFAGVGAFALAMQETGCLRLTHAIEISPSAARTLQ